LEADGSQGITISLEVKGSQGNNYYLGGLDNLLGGCWPSRELIYLAAVDPQENFVSLAVATFSWPLGKLSLVIVSLAANLQRNHP